MKQSEIEARFASIKVWRKGDERAPHKPLLLLYSLGKLQSGQRWLPYPEVQTDVGKLLQEFGPARSTSPIYPFQYLESDGFWSYYPKRPNHFRASELTKSNIAGGFSPDMYRALEQNPGLVRQLAQNLLEQHFPQSLHQDILDAVGLDLEVTSEATQVMKKPARDPKFRDRILQAYEYRCAVCGFHVFLGTVPLALEAAHIKWHQYGGPDREENGLALCSLHHKLFDRGAFTLEPDGEKHLLRVSQKVHGSKGFEEWLMRYHDQHLSEPQSSLYTPKLEFTQWHVKEVFQGSPRHPNNA